MIPITLILFVLLNTRDSLEDLPLNTSLAEKQLLDDYILCRSCGADISSSSYIFTKLSPESQYTFKDTLFEREGVFVQLLLTGIYIDFPVITATHSTCLSLGEWEESGTWFPGYRWKACICPECGLLVGWVFVPVNAELIQPNKVFFGLILTSLIGESCKIFLFLWFGYGLHLVIVVIFC